MSMVRSKYFAFLVSSLSISVCTSIPSVLGPQGFVSSIFCIQLALSWSAVLQRFSIRTLLRGRFASPAPLSHCFFFHQCDESLLFSLHVGVYGWIVRICQPWKQSPSSVWLPIVRGPRSSTARQLLISIKGQRMGQALTKWVQWGSLSQVRT